MPLKGPQWCPQDWLQNFWSLGETKIWIHHLKSYLKFQDSVAEQETELRVTCPGSQPCSSQLTGNSDRQLVSSFRRTGLVHRYSVDRDGSRETAEGGDMRVAGDLCTQRDSGTHSPLWSPSMRRHTSVWLPDSALAINLSRGKKQSFALSIVTAAASTLVRCSPTTYRIRGSLDMFSSMT